jgi:hypothetical protein
MVAQNLPDRSFKKTVAYPLMQATELIPMLPYVSTGGEFSQTRFEQTSVPQPSWRRFNDTPPTESRTLYRRETRWWGLMSILVKLDKRFRDAPARWQSHVELQIRGAGQGAAFEAQRVFLNGNHLSVAEEPDGIKQILNAGIAAGYIPSAQRIDVGTGGDTLTFAHLDQLKSVVYGDNLVALLNPFFFRKLLALARDASTSGILRIGETRSIFGTPLTEYAGVKLLNIEKKHDHSSDLPFTEDDGSSNLDTSRIWMVNLAENMGVYAFGPDSGMGMQMPALQDVPLTHFVGSLGDWGVGFGSDSPTGIGAVIHLNAA